MNTNHDLYLDLCAALAAGSIEPEDRRVLEEHLDGRCAECLAFLRDLSIPIEALARSVPPAKPSRGLKARVMVAISQGRGPGGGPVAPRPAADDGPDRVLPVWAWVVIVALALAAAFGWWRVGMRDAQRENEPIDTPRVRPQEARYAEFVAKARGAKHLQLARTPDAPPELSKDVSVEVVYDEATRRAAVRVKGGAPAGRVLELWTVRDKKPYSEGLIPADGIVFIENTGDPKALGAFAVSVEGPQGAVNRETPAQVSMAAATS